MDRFLICLAKVLEFEKDGARDGATVAAVGPRVTDHPSDPGGRTNDGVTQENLDELRASRGQAGKPVDEMTVEERNAVYRGKWDAVRGDLLGPALDLAVFDYAVNSGPGRAVRELQTVLGAVADGRFGPATAGRLAAILGPPDSGRHGRAVALAFRLCDRREAFLKRIVERNPELKVFARGWANRLLSLRGFLPYT